jgi:hypothetical protein
MGNAIEGDEERKKTILTSPSLKYILDFMSM